MISALPKLCFQAVLSIRNKHRDHPPRLGEAAQTKWPGSNSLNPSFSISYKGVVWFRGHYLPLEQALSLCINRDIDADGDTISSSELQDEIHERMGKIKYPFEIQYTRSRDPALLIVHDPKAKDSK